MNMIAARFYKREGGAALQECGSVVSVAPLTVRAQGVDHRARRAVSCLVAPRPGDDVLLLLLDGRAAYVLAVLERPEPGAELTIEGDCTLRATGQMHIAARERMSVVSGEDLGIVAGRFSLRSVASTIASETLELVSRSVTGELDRAKIAARSYEGFFDRVTHRIKRSLRVIEEHDQVRAGRIDYGAKEEMTLHGDNAVVTARKLVKVDGGQIQLG
jgi:hypothetical protein